MATIKGANRTIADAITPSTILSPGLAGGKVRCMIDTFTGTAAIATNTIAMGGTLPVGATVIDVIVDNPHASTFTVGDVDSASRYNASVAATSLEHIDAAGGINYIVDGDDDQQVTLTVVGAAMTAGLTLTVAILYTIE